jgi:hypothetical protein
MPETDSRAGTRHLVDPEVAPILDVFPPFNFTPQRLAAIRSGLTSPVPGAPDPAALFPGVTVTEHRVPGEDGDPDVRVLLYQAAARAAW